MFVNTLYYIVECAFDVVYAIEFRNLQAVLKSTANVFEQVFGISIMNREGGLLNFSPKYRREDA